MWRQNDSSRVASCIEHTTLDIPYPREFHSVHVMLRCPHYDVTLQQAITKGINDCNCYCVLWFTDNFIMAEQGHNLYTAIESWSANGSVLMCVLFQKYCFLYQQNNRTTLTTCLSRESGLTTKSAELLQASYVDVAQLTRSHNCEADYVNLL